MSISIKYYEKLAEMIEFREGKPYWIERPYKANNVDINKPAGTITGGYRRICCTINKISKSIKTHRLLWFQVYGELPEMLDHINHIKDDNRIDNLRVATHGQNMRNRKTWGKSKYNGVSWKGKKWEARCQINKEQFYLGRFTSEIEAAKAYDNFCIENNLTFANLNFKQENKQEL